jgi:pilus assembly protein TadC
VACAAAVAALLVRPRPVLAEARAPSSPAPAVGWLHRHRLLWSALAGLGGFTFVSGPVGLPAGAVAGFVTWVVIGRAEPAGSRARRRAIAHDLPHLVALFAATLRAGSAPSDGITQVCAALPGPAAERLSGVAARLSLGLAPADVWSSLADEPVLAPLGRTMARAQETGAPVVAAVERLSDELARTARADTEERARAVGVRAAVPLGLCLLPAFVLIGIVPLVVALMVGLGL